MEHNRPLLPANLKDYWDLLVFAQHHSMPTRLLDWTYSPLTALWFACHPPSVENDGYVYIIECDKFHEARFEYSLYQVDYPHDAVVKELVPMHRFINFITYGNKSILLLQPSPMFERLITQSGIFTVFPNEPGNFLHAKLKVRASKKGEILKELALLNINEYTIYKDYDSFCRTLFWQAYSSYLT